MTEHNAAQNTTTDSSVGSARLWSDDPAVVDLLAFSAVAQTVVEAVLDESLDPIALGLSGPWGSGKTTVLRLIQGELAGVDDHGKKVLLVPTDPWRYDPAVGAKETLIAEVLACLKTELEATAGDGSAKTTALGLLKRLAARVDWARAIRLAARTSITLQLPSFDDVVNLVRPSPDAEADERTPGLDAFREEFAELMASEALAHVRRVVVLVDDLDRCLPETVIETLEAMRLFLAVPKMSFVIAADEDRVADAIRTRFGAAARSRGDADELTEPPEKLYLHKIVQTTVPIPALSRFDTEAYLVLLQLAARLPEADVLPYVNRCDELRREAGRVEDLTDGAAHEIDAELQFAARLTPIIYEKLHGNPRRIKRFLNDLHVRQSIADRRGIKLAPEIVAKLMVLEVLLPEGFKRVLDWLARNTLRDQIAALESAAGRDVDAATPPVAGKGKNEKGASPEAEESSADTDADFPQELLRWAKLPPALTAIDLAPYLYLAAAFAGTSLLDADLPDHLRDIAANLASAVRAEQKSVTDDDLRGLTTSDSHALIRHLGRVARDRPNEQRPAVHGLLRVTRLHPETVDGAATVLARIPADEIQPASVLIFKPEDVISFKSVLESWADTATSNPTKQAIAEALKETS